MNRNRATAAPAQPADGGAGELRPAPAILAALLCLLATLLPASLLPIVLRRAWGLPRARALTPAQHRRALGHLRALGAAQPLPARAHPFRAGRQARRRAAECWRLLIARPRRRAVHPRPLSARRPRAHPPRPHRQPPHARAGPGPPPVSTLPAASSPHAHFVTLSYLSPIAPPSPAARMAPGRPPC